MLRILGLDQHFARALAAAGAAGDLHDGLGEALGGAEVGAEQALVGVQHDDQRDVREIVALGHHLRADQDPRLAARDPVDDGLERGRVAHHVAIEPRDRHVREGLGERVLDALRALADGLHCIAALRALARQWPLGAAVVAAAGFSALRCTVSARRSSAGRDPAAGRAQQRRRVAAAVDVDQHLAVGGEMLLDACQRRARQPGVHGFLPQVDRRSAAAAPASPRRGSDSRW
jgi:hypothetical protein